MDLVIRGRSRDQHGARTRGGPERSQAGQDQRAREDQSGSRQDRTRGHGGKSRGGPREQGAASAVGGCTPEGARGQGSSTEWPSLKQLQQFQSKPASDERVGQGARVSSSFASLKQRRWFV